MSKLLCNVLKISWGGKCLKCSHPLVARLMSDEYHWQLIIPCSVCVCKDAEASCGQQISLNKWTTLCCSTQTVFWPFDSTSRDIRILSFKLFGYHKNDFGCSCSQTLQRWLCFYCSAFYFHRASNSTATQ